MIEKILESLDESAQSGGGRHSVRPLSLELAIEAKHGPDENREAFESALYQLARASTPFMSSPNGLSPYQATLLIGMALELRLTALGDIVAANFLLLRSSPVQRSPQVQELLSYCLKFLLVIDYGNDSFWLDILSSNSSEISHRALSAEWLCNSHPDSVIRFFNQLFSNENTQRGALAWNIFAKIERESPFAMRLVDSAVVPDVDLFLDSLDAADPSGASRKKIERWIGLFKADNVVVLFSDFDYRKVAAK
jgi:hypothetical protein